MAESVKRDLIRIHKLVHRWYMYSNNRKTKAQVVSRSRIVDSPYGELVLSNVNIRACSNLDILVYGLTTSSHLRFMYIYT